jgi:hypothetical protein
MKYLKKFEIAEYRYTDSHEDDDVISDIKDNFLEIEDLGYEVRMWINEKDNFKKLDYVKKIIVEFNKNKKVPKEDFEIVIDRILLLNDRLKGTNFKVTRIDLYDFTKETTPFNIIDSLDDEITTDLDNVNTYYIYINKIKY